MDSFIKKTSNIVKRETINTFKIIKESLEGIKDIILNDTFKKEIRNLLKKDIKLKKKNIHIYKYQFLEESFFSSSLTAWGFSLFAELSLLRINLILKLIVLISSFRASFANDFKELKSIKFLFYFLTLFAARLLF